MEQMYVSIVSTVILAIIGFFLIRYFRSVDTKLETISADLNANILATNTIKTEQSSWSKLLTETKTKLQDFTEEIRGVLERMNDKFDKRFNVIDEDIKENTENIIRLEERENVLIRRMDRLEAYQDSCKFKSTK